MQIWLDGRMVEAAAARVSPLDSGWRLGDGVFSTLLAVNGAAQRVDTHVARVLHDAAALGITGLVPERLAAAVHRVADANTDHDELVLRLVVTRGPVAPDAPFGAVSRTPTVAVLAAPAPAASTTATATLIAGGRRPAAIKSTSWAWSAQALATARAAGADTGLFTENGQVLEAAAANLVVRLGENLVTPPADGRILPGTTRALLLEVVDDLREGVLTTDDLHRADEVLLTSAVRGAVPVVAVDDHPVGSGRPGPTAERVLAALRSAGVGPAGG